MRSGMRKRRLVLAVLVVACADSPAGRDDFEEPGGGGEDGTCFSDSDCPTGLRCEDLRCVAEDGLPPEVEEDRTFMRPVASEHFVFALSPEGDSLAIIDPATLAIEAVALPDEPVAAAVVPGEDAVVALSRAGGAVTLVTREGERTRLVTMRTPRRFPAVALSPDGRWALLWTPEGELPDAGAEGVVALVDVEALASGTPAPVLERAAGRRHTDVFFRTSEGVTTEAVVVGKEELAVLDLVQPDAEPVPRRVALPDDYAEIVTREAVAPPDGSVVLLRSLATPELGVFDVAARAFSTVTLPGVASDLELVEDGRRAVAVLRERSEVVRLRVPEGDELETWPVALPGRDCPEEEEPCLVAPGQAVLTADGTKAALFTNARRSESFGWLDLATGELVVLDRLQKLVRTLGLSADGTRAIVLHRPDAGSTVADLYERRVDQSEGYSVVDLEQGVSQLKLTDDVPPLEFVWATDERYAAVTLRRDASPVYRAEAIDLATLLVAPLELASAPEYAGPLPGGAADARVWVTQVHPAGRISFVDLAARTVRTATGYELNSEIDR